MLICLTLGTGCPTEEPADDDTSGDDDVADDDTADDDTADDDSGDDDSAPQHGCAVGDYHVAPDGDDTNPGTLALPFATLEAARTAVRDRIATSGVPVGGLTVVLREGVYPLEQTFELTSEDAGEAGSPVVYCGYLGETVRLTGGLQLDPVTFSLVEDWDPVWDRLEPAGQGHVHRVNLSLVTNDYGTLEPRGAFGDDADAALELFVDGAPMQLARWPDKVEAADVDPAIHAIEVHGAGLNPDVSGQYQEAGTYNGQPYYERAGGGWYIYYRDVNGVYYLGNHADLGGTGDFYAWWSRGGGSPLGSYHPDSGSPTGEPLAIEEGFVPGFMPILDTDGSTHFVVEDGRAARWGQADALWFHGFWGYWWADDHVPAAAVDTGSGDITLDFEPSYGLGIGQAYYAYNLIEEISVEGEWYLDRASGVLYWWPPGDDVQREIVVSILDEPLVRISGTHHVELQALTLEASRDSLAEIDGGFDVALRHCHLRNSGRHGVEIDGSNHTVERCLIEDVGERGVDIDGGDRLTLTSSGHVLVNNQIRRFGRFCWTYDPAIYIDDSAIGVQVRHNTLHDAPHTAILYNGNDHLIELNEISDVCQWTSDAGAICTGRDWSAQGTVLRHNFIHHVQSRMPVHGVQAIYWDDCASGQTAEGNVLYEIDDAGIQAGGGRDHTMVNNLFVHARYGLKTDNRGISRITNTPGDSWNMLEKIQAMHYQDEPWASAYPRLAAIPDDWATISDPATYWLYPEGCVLSRNLGWDLLEFAHEYSYGGTGEVLAVFDEIADNMEDADPLFTDEGSLDLSLQPGSPADSIPGWIEIPFEDIGVEPE